MMSFRGSYLSRLALPVSSVWLVGDIAEAKGRQDGSSTTQNFDYPYQTLISSSPFRHRSGTSASGAG
jgi:hypothetical protein